MTVALVTSPAMSTVSSDTLAPLWQVNPEASPARAADFAEIAGEVIHELLDEAVARGGMTSNRAWLVQQLVQARDAAQGHMPS